MKTQFIVLFAFLCCLAGKTIAQDDPEYRMKLIRERLPEKDLTLLDKADNILTSAYLMIEEINPLLNELAKYEEASNQSDDRRVRKESKKTIRSIQATVSKKRIKAAEIFEKGYDMSFTVHYDYLNSQVAFVTNSTQVRKSMADAKRIYAVARQKLTKLTDREKYEYLMKELDEVLAMKQEGLNMLLEAYCLFLDCSPPLVVDVNVPSADSLVVTDTDFVQTDIHPQTNNKVTKEESPISYRVQIIAVRTPLTQDRLKNIYRGKSEINPPLFENGLYKYSVGNFSSYEQAKSLRNDIGGDSFIVAFKDGKRVALPE